MNEIQEGIKRMGFDEEMAENLSEIVRITREAAIEECVQEIDGLKREILRCDDACFKRDKEIAELKRRVAGLWACTGCGSMQSIEQIRTEHPEAIACCPERKMAPPVSPSQRETP